MLNTSFTFLRTNGQPLAKVFTPDGVTPYPLAKKLHSIEHTYSNDADGIEEFYSDLKVHAREGHALLKGGLQRPLVNESRRGLWDQRKTTTWLVVDIDKISFASLNLLPGDSLSTIERRIVSYLPEPFQMASRIVHASSSFRMSQQTTSIHLFYLLNQEYNTEVLKDYILELNFRNPFANALRLSGSAQSVLWVIDPAIVDNTRIVYIADPLFENVDNPYPESRFELVKSSRPVLNLQEEIENLDFSKTTEKKRKTLNRLRKENNLAPYRPRLQNVLIDNQIFKVCTNPEQLKMEFVRQNESWVYYNVNDGDSNAYYVWKSNPNIVWNFKGEPPFLFKEANEEVYQWHITHFSDDIVYTVRAICFRDFKTDRFYAGLYDYQKDEFVQIARVKKENIKGFMAQHGEVLASTDSIQTWDYIFDPTSGKVLDLERKIANRFSPTELLKQPDALDFGDSYDTWSIEQFEKTTPVIYRVIKSITGDCPVCMRHFMNWLAFIYQRREKTKTAWVFSGTQGTGKGAFFSLIARGIFGEYCAGKTVENIEEKFNDYLETSLLVCIEEFKIADSKTPNKLKNLMNTYITEPVMTIRAMQENQKEVISYSNFIIFTNELEIMPLHEQERRYNVAPRQEISLPQRYGPIIKHQIKNEVPQELAAFTAILRGFPVDEYHAETPLENEAKELMRDMSKTTIHQFTTALRIGDYEYFLEIFNVDPPLAGDDYVTPAKNIVRDWGRQLLAAKAPVVIRLPSARGIYLYKAFVNPNTTLQKYSKTMALHGLKTKFIRDGTKAMKAFEFTFPILEEGLKPIVQNMLDENPRHMSLIKN